jgi:chromosome segregation ATPase
MGELSAKHLRDNMADVVFNGRALKPVGTASVS